MKDSLSIVAMAINLLYNRRFKCETKPIMSVLIINEKATPSQMIEMMLLLGSYIKLAVDVEREILAGGGTLHADCEGALIDDGSQQENVWGADWFPSPQQVTFESMINIRPRLGLFTTELEDPDLRKVIEKIVRKLLEGVAYE